MPEKMLGVISGEIVAKKPLIPKIETEIPKIIAEGSREIEVPKLEEEQEVVDIDSLKDEKSLLEEKSGQVFRSIRTYQDMLKRHKDRPDVVDRLIGESKPILELHKQLEAKINILKDKIAKIKD